MRLIEQRSGGGTGGYGLRLGIWYRAVTAADAGVTNYTWTIGGAPTHNGAAGVISTFMNVDTSNPIVVDAGQTTSSGTSHSTPDLGVLATNTMLVSTHAALSSARWTPPSGMTEILDWASQTVPDALGMSLEINTEERPSPGYTGTRTASFSSPAPSGDAGATHILALRPYQADPTISMVRSSPSGGSLIVGSTASYALTIGNNGPMSISAGNISVTNTLPAGLTYVSRTGTGWTCNAAGQVVTCTYSGATLASGATLPVLTLNVNVVSGTSWTNTATVSSGSDGDNNLSNSTATDTWPTNITTLSTGSDPAALTIGPGVTATDVNVFRLQTNTGTEPISAVTINLSSHAGIDDIFITDNANNVLGSVKPTASGSVSIPVIGMTATTTLQTFKIRVEPLVHVSMPAPPGATYTVTAYVTGWTGPAGHAGSDTDTNVLTIDNESPSSATAASAIPGTTSTTLNWTTSSSGDFATTSGSIVYRWDGATAGSEVPIEGSSPLVGETNGMATVVCVVSSAASTALTRTNGSGGGSGCSNTALVSGQQYTYKVFQRDTRGNYDVGVVLQKPVLTVADASLTEGNSGQTNMSFTVTKSMASAAVASASYSLATGSATGGASCTSGVDFVSTGGTVSFPSGATTAMINVPVCGDTTVESAETFTLTLSNPVNAELDGATATGTIVDDDYYCYTDTFTGANNSVPSSDWRTTSSSGSFGQPRIFNNRLRLTDASNDVSTAAHLQKAFPGAGNKIIVEFDYYAYNGNGADGIALTFSDAAVSPYAGAYGGSLGYAQKTGINGFAGGWLGIGIDEYGNFRNDSEGRGDGGSPTGLVPDSISIRGSGSGTSGYLIHAESGSLTPGVDQPGTTAGPNHRYRITIDHMDGTHAYVKVERNTGSGYTTIIPQYDAKTKAGQAAVPTNWLLSFTGATGGSTNIHEIDNLQVCAYQPILPLGPDHYVVSHSGTGLTCEAEPVTITAHDASHARKDASGYTISLSTSTGKGNWTASADGCTQTCYNTSGTAQACGGSFSSTPSGSNTGMASYTFSAGETGVRLCLRHNDTGTVNINVTDSFSSESGGSASAEASPGADPGLVFSNTGFRFYADDSVDTLGSLTAGLRSDTIEATLQPVPQTLTIRALKSTETIPARCMSLLGAGAQTVKFAYQCIDPAACHASTAGLEVNGTVVTGSAVAPTPGSDVSVAFNGSGVGTINLKYWDVGQIKLYAQARIADPLTGTTTSTGPLIATGASNTFLVKPYGFDVKACTSTTPCTVANNSNVDGTGSVFAKAGETFSVTVTAVAYGGTVVSPSFGMGTGNTGESVQLAPIIVAPAGGSNGVLGGTANITRNNFSNGVASVSNLTWSEVGVMNLRATNSTFQTVATAASGSSGNIGRFTPHHFGVAGTELLNRSDVDGSAALPNSSFTYMGEPLRMTIAVTAYNKGEVATQNYTGNFAKLNATALGTTTANWTCTSGTQCMGLGAVSGSSNLTSRLAIDTAVANGSAAPVNTTSAGGATVGWLSGTSYFTFNTIFSRGTTPDGPYDVLKFGAKPLDTDGITIPLRNATDTMHCVNLDITSGTENALCDPGATESYLRRKLFETAIRYGRLRIANAFGSEHLALPMTALMEYYSGGRWITNSDDSLTTLSVLGGPSGAVGLTPSGSTTPRCNVSGNTCTAISGVACNASSAIANGNLGLCLTKPDVAGQADISFAPRAYLQINGVANPKGRAGFGIYSQTGNSQRIIHRQEVR